MLALSKARGPARDGRKLRSSEIQLFSAVDSRPSPEFSHGLALQPTSPRSERRSRGSRLARLAADTGRRRPRARAEASFCLGWHHKDHQNKNMAECVFCEIVAGRAPASVVYRDEACVAFMDITPVNAGHLLIVPITHATYLADLDTQTGGALFTQ